MPSKIDILQQRKNEIIKELKPNHINELINYQQFQELYKSYNKEMSEQQFAELLGITYGNYKSMKNSGRRARIFKIKYKKLSKEQKEEIRQELRTKGYTNTLIDYKEFKEIYGPYKSEVSEQDFAEISKITDNNYKNMKYRGIKTRILKKEKQEISQERKQKKKEISQKIIKEIQEKLKKQGYTNKSIDYQEFKALYEAYQKEMTEQQFAEVLEITGTSYNSIKYKKGTKAKILKEKEKKITEERIEEIREELKGYENKLIDYQKFKELYKLYKNEMEEKQFTRILGITNSSFSSMKNRGTKARILKEEKDEITEERKQEIQGVLKEYANKLVNYQKFQEIYGLYKNEMNEQDFAEILGIKYASYMSMKNSQQRARIQFNRDKLSIIKYQIQNKNREYKKEELEELCKKYNITLKDVLTSIFGQGKLVEKLINKDIIYIGKCELPREFSEKYAKQLLEVVNKLSKELTCRYRMRNIEEDIASETLIYILNSKGDIVKNSETDEEALSSIEGYMYISLKYKCIKNLTINKAISLDSGIGKKFTRIRNLHEIIKDPKAEFEKKIESNLSESNEEGIVSRMKQCYEKGKNNTEAIKTVIEEYGISKEELLEILKKELMKKKKIKKTKAGKVYLGEEIE